MKLPHPGEILEDKYQLEEMLGEGAYGLVVKATTLSTNRPVAVKMLKPSKGGYKTSRTQRFMRELRVIAQLQCPNTLTLYDFGKTGDGVLYMVTEFVEGEDLFDLLERRGTLSEKEALHVLHQALLSLSEAHEAGVLHRDIKPHNIRLTSYQGDPLRVKVLDFGLSKTLEDEASSTLTAAGVAVGTPRYMSPEQLKGRELGPESDIYSLGLVAYEMLVRRPDAPHRSSGPGREVQIEASHDVSDPVRMLVNNMLQPRARRYQSAAEVLAAVKAVRAGQMPPAPQPPPPLRSSSGRFPAASRSGGELPVARTGPHSVVRTGPQSVVQTGAHAAINSSMSSKVYVAAALGVILALGAGVYAVWNASSEPAASLRRASPTPTPSHGLLATDEDLGDAPEIDTPPSEIPAVVPDLAEGVCAGREKFPSGIQEIGRLEGITREDALVWLPPDYDPSRKYPVVWLFHDFNHGPRDFLQGLDLASVKELEPFVVLASRSVSRPVWTSEADLDVATVDLNVARELLCIDDSRIFVWGHGLGGRVAAIRSLCMTEIAAVATTSFRTQKLEQFCEPDKLVPYLHLSATRDSIAPPEGGYGCLAKRMGGPLGQILGFRASLDAQETYFRKRYGCSGEPTTYSEHAHGTCETWSTCDAPLVSCRVEGGRPLPGVATERQICSTSPVNFPYTRTVFEFFSNFVRADR